MFLDSNGNSDAVRELVEIGKPVYGGSFLARLEGKAVFVPLTLPGEQARIRVTQTKPGYAMAEADELAATAPERVAPLCPHFGACGGCQYQHAGYAAQLGFKQAILRETLERAGVEPPQQIDVLAGEPSQSWRYRNRIRVAFDKAGNPGYRGRRSHDIVPIRECPIAAPLLVDAALAAASLLREMAPAFRPTELALFCDAEESSLLASLFAERTGKLRFEAFAAALQQRIPALTGADFALEGRNNQPPRTVARWGATSLAYRAAGFAYRVDHGAFFQVNRWLVDALVDRVTAGHQGALAWDLYAGVGLFARRLTASFDHVIAVESAPASTQALAANLKGTHGIPVRAATLDFLRRNGRAANPDFVSPGLIVVDPPRTGLGAETCALLAETAAPAIAYVSCDPATLARDLRSLTGSGYTIASATVTDLFPQTFHLETVVQLRRA